MKQLTVPKREPRLFSTKQSTSEITTPSAPASTSQSSRVALTSSNSGVRIIKPWSRTWRMQTCARHSGTPSGPLTRQTVWLSALKVPACRPERTMSAVTAVLIEDVEAIPPLHQAGRLLTPLSMERNGWHSDGEIAHPAVPWCSGNTPWNCWSKSLEDGPGSTNKDKSSSSTP